jgi:predicted ribosomally synthesized peptide with SipW-like signal peptide
MPATRATENEVHHEQKWRPNKAVVARGLALLGSLLLVSVVTITGSRAAFSDTTDNSANSFTAGSVELVDDDSGSSMFSVSNMMPGDTAVECIVVTYQGSIADPPAVKLYSGGYTDSGDFGDYLNLTIEEGSGGSFGDCTGFSAENTIESGGTLADFDSTHTDYATGAGVWDPSSTPESKTYRFTFELDSSTPNAEQGESVTALTFTWEVTS